MKYQEKVERRPDPDVRYPDDVERRSDPDVRYSDEVERRPDKMAAVRHPDKIEHWSDKIQIRMERAMPLILRGREPHDIF